jgi:hypothetical protein
MVARFAGLGRLLARTRISITILGHLGESLTSCRPTGKFIRSQLSSKRLSLVLNTGQFFNPLFDLGVLILRVYMRRHKRGRKVSESQTSDEY